ncbi:MAG: tRNA (adenosine(37)-N6)-dimethylallyltransferase MiaA [Candidatus Moranbacteria bacterium CG_4_9_14_3_um_filter_42_9]|nr:MAG: tRNA (adenosine(37)-N6)-dimethylallyltransferase MiaA [Candidatus Moranbacteria bacterium CG_4_9_14_3_um_filter_42_9]
MESGRDKDKIIIILGPTSSGKSVIAIRLARKFNGEIISADSRQIYRGMDIGTGKVTAAEQKMARHWMLDVASPKTNFNVTQFKRKAEKIISDILERKKVPIICGGTGFWIKAVVDNVSFPRVKPDWKLREKLGDLSSMKLFSLLKKLDSERARTIDKKNKVRLIRAIEICKKLGRVPKIKTFDFTADKIEFTKFLQIGVDVPRETLNEKIRKRLKKRFQAGLVEEVKTLKKTGLSWKKIQSFGLCYFWVPLYLEGKISLDELEERIYLAEKDYAKRQMTWFRKDKRIIWLRSYADIEREAKRFLSYSYK